MNERQPNKAKEDKSLKERIEAYKKALHGEGGLLSDLDKQAIRFGLANDLAPVGIAGSPLPRIVLCIQDAWKNKDEKWLRDELLAHGIDFKYEKQGDGVFSTMAYILFRIAGLKLDEIKFDLGISNLSKIHGRISKVYLEEMNRSIRERKEFMLLHPELDYTKERVYTRQLKSVGEYLDIIKKETGLGPLEVFNPEYIPEYSPRRENLNIKSTVHRSLKEVLDEVCIVLTNPSWDEIEKLTGRKKNNILDSLANRLGKSVGKKPRPGVMSVSFIRKALEARINFQNSADAKAYPLDEINYRAILEKI